MFLYHLNKLKIQKNYQGATKATIHNPFEFKTCWSKLFDVNSTTCAWHNKNKERITRVCFNISEFKKNRWRFLIGGKIYSISSQTQSNCKCNLFFFSQFINTLIHLWVLDILNRFLCLKQIC
jgi:hypothetical protein